MQVNYGINLTTLIGLIYIILSIVYFIATILLLTRRANRPNYSALVLSIFQAIIVPSLLLVSGIILLFQGWRLDFILQFQQFLLFGLITYFIVKDIVIR